MGSRTGADGVFAATKGETKKERLEVIRGQLEIERSSWDAHWRDLADHILPRRIRFNTTDTNRGVKKNTRILDNTPTLANRTLRAGMMSGITSPARPWFKLSLPDKDLAESGAIKGWLDTVTKRMQGIYLRSNIYNSLPTCYGDLGCFGTGCIFLEEDKQNVLHSTIFPIGSYSISTNDKGQVRTFMREFRMTVRQIVDKFAERDSKGNPKWDNISIQVRDLWKKQQFESWVDVMHFVLANEDYNPVMSAAKFKRYASIYYERGTDRHDGSQFAFQDDKILLEDGFDMFPVLAPRWQVQGQDIYGSESPGMVSLGDIKQLQLGEKRILQAVEKMINPPMTGPASLQNRKASILPGDITYLDTREGERGFRPVHEIRFDISQMELKQQQTRTRVQRSFYEDLFLMLANTDRRQITATEVVERVEEKLLALGPVLEQLNQDLLDPLIDNTFQFMLNQNLVPEPPQELQGQELKVEYISIMAQAQKLVGVSNIERFTGFAGGVAQTNPEVLDKVNSDELIDAYADRMSIDPGIVRSDEDVKEIRAARAKQQQQQAVAEAGALAAKSAKDLSDAKLDENNALSAVANQTAEDLV